MNFFLILIFRQRVTQKYHKSQKLLDSKTTIDYEIILKEWYRLSYTSNDDVVTYFYNLVRYL